MTKRLKEPFGKAGLIVAIVALTAALAGGAYAAAKLNPKQKKEVQKIAKKYAGKPGQPGAAGPAGPAGAKGDTGAKGDNGTNGTNGTNGQSVTTSSIPATPSSECPNVGGTKFTSASGTSKVCNGANGEDGETGFTETLPPGETETGMWALGPNNKTTVVPLSFNIPLAQAPKLHFVNVDEEEITGEASPSNPPVTPPVNCLGSYAEPEALPGHLCVYEGKDLGESLGYFGNAELTVTTTAGATFFYVIAENQVAIGSWAVTAALTP